MTIEASKDSETHSQHRTDVLLTYEETSTSPSDGQPGETKRPKQSLQSRSHHMPILVLVSPRSDKLSSTSLKKTRSSLERDFVRKESLVIQGVVSRILRTLLTQRAFRLKAMSITWLQLALCTIRSLISWMTPKRTPKRIPKRTPNRAPKRLQ